MLLEAALVVGSAVVGLRLASVPRLQRLSERWHRPAEGHTPDAATRDRVVWAVGVASHFLPRASCLPRTLAAQLLLGRRGLPTQLRIGVARRGADAIAAHAWLENAAGTVIYDPEDRTAYTPLDPLSPGDEPAPRRAPQHP